ncbi:MAG TPA: hypothetical protein VFQ86_01875 [Arachidicoccus soli]|nr:hypothetical protein [Arachidicoccus soli]
MKLKNTLTAILTLGIPLLITSYIFINTPAKVTKADKETTQIKQIEKPIVKEAPKPLTTNELIIKYFPANQVANAELVVKCESGGDASIVGHNHNGTTDTGLFQLNSVHHYPGDLTNPETNIKLASELYRARGWQPWYSSRKCHHLV